MGGSTVYLDYDATISGHTKVLDEIDEVEKVLCSKSKLEIRFSANSNLSARTSFADLFQMNRTMMVHGGPEWGCLDDKTNEASPFYYHVFKAEIMRNDILILDGEPCSPFMAFQHLSWTLWSAPNSNATQPVSMHPELRNSHSKANGVVSRSTFDYSWTVEPLSITSDLLNELCSAKKTNCEKIDNSTIFSANASFEISPVRYNWTIDVSHKLNPPSLSFTENTMWLQYIQNTALSSSVNVGPNSYISASYTFPVISSFPFPGTGFTFKIGDVSFKCGLTASMDMEVDVNFAPGTTIDMQYGSSCSANTGFQYDGSTYNPIHNYVELDIPTYAGKYARPNESIGFELHMLPQLSVGAGGTFEDLGENIDFEVSNITRHSIFS